MQVLFFFVLYFTPQQQVFQLFWMALFRLQNNLFNGSFFHPSPFPLKFFVCACSQMDAPDKADKIYRSVPICRPCARACAPSPSLTCVCEGACSRSWGGAAVWQRTPRSWREEGRRMRPRPPPRTALEIRWLPSHSVCPCSRCSPAHCTCAQEIRTDEC